MLCLIPEDLIPDRIAPTVATGTFATEGEPNEGFACYTDSAGFFRIFDGVLHSTARCSAVAHHGLCSRRAGQLPACGIH